MTYPLYANIELQPLNDPRFSTKIIHPTLEPVIYELAVKHPNWVFKDGHMRDAGDRVLHVVAFSAFDDKDNRLGIIEVSRNYGGRSSSPWVFEVRNDRIANAKQRGDRFTSGNRKKVLKTVEKYFGAPTIIERIQTARHAAANHVYYAVHKAEHLLNQVCNETREEFDNYIKAHWDEVLTSMTDAARAVAETIPTLQEESNSITKLHEQINSNAHLTVLIDGDTYITHVAGKTETYTTDNLPEGIKINVGMLKLSEIKNTVANIGVRVSDNAFILYAPSSTT